MDCPCKGLLITLWRFFMHSVDRKQWEYAVQLNFLIYLKKHKLPSAPECNDKASVFSLCCFFYLYSCSLLLLFHWQIRSWMYCMFMCVHLLTAFLMYTLGAECTWLYVLTFICSLTNTRLSLSLLTALFLLFISVPFFYIFPEFPSVSLTKTPFVSTSPHLPPWPAGRGCGIKRHSVNPLVRSAVLACSAAELQRSVWVRSASMKKVYNLVNITKAKDQEAVQSICIKVSLLCFKNVFALFAGIFFSHEFSWRDHSTGLYVELGRS